MAFITGYLAKSYTQTACIATNFPDYLKPLTNLSVRATDIPKGVFVHVQGDKYYPTVHGLGIGSHQQVGLVRLGGELENPVTIDFETNKQYVVLNTGDQPLRFGDEFVVEYPRPVDTAAQLKAYTTAAARRMCSEKSFVRSEKLWGGFLATRKIESSVTAEILTKLTRDVKVIQSSSLIVALAEINKNVASFAGPTSGVLANVSQAMDAGGQMPSAATIRNAFPTKELEIVSKIIGACTELLNVNNFVTAGRCIGSTVANPMNVSWGGPSDVPTGVCFNAIMSHFSGL